MKATTSEVLVISYGGLKGARHINNIVKIQGSGQTMKHTMSGILPLKFLRFESVEAYDVGSGKRFTPGQWGMDLKDLKGLQTYA